MLGRLEVMANSYGNRTSSASQAGRAGNTLSAPGLEFSAADGYVPGMRIPGRFPAVGAAAVLIAASGFLSIEPSVAAETPKQISVFNDWSVYAVSQGKAKTCYVVSYPKSTEPKGAKRSEVSILVSHKQGDKSKGEINVNAGYNYKKGAKVELSVDKDTFQLETFDKPGYLDSAFAADGKDDAIIAALEKGRKIVVKGASDKGTQTTDTYSLTGAPAALKAMWTACK
jgi:invasion protein IalB